MKTYTLLFFSLVTFGFCLIIYVLLFPKYIDIPMNLGHQYSTPFSLWKLLKIHNRSSYFYSQWPNNQSTPSVTQIAELEVFPADNSEDDPMTKMVRFMKNKKKFAKNLTKIIVPNIVHYVWLSNGQDLKFHHMLGMLSAQKYLNPDVMKLHCDKEPTGLWWRLYKEDLTSLKIVFVDRKITINGIEPSVNEVKADILRMRIIQREGGIYLDFDVMVIQSFDDLRKYEFTLGLEYHGNPGRVNNGIIISAPNARFLRVWFDAYKDFQRDEWDFHSCSVPYLLAPKYPSLIHVDEKRLNYPGGNQYSMIFYENYNWTNNYAMHLWYRMYSYSKPLILEFTPQNIKILDSTFGQLARRTLYEYPELIKEP